MTGMVHIFEEVGLGTAPFRFVGVEIRRYRAHPQAPGQPGGSCQYCGTAIVECCLVRDAQGREFVVGNECIRKAGDAGLRDPMKRALNKARREARHAADDERIGQARQLLELPTVRERLSGQPHPVIKGHTLADYVVYMFAGAGRAGAVKAARLVERAADGRE